MAILIITSLVLIGITIVIHGVGTTQWLGFLTSRYVADGSKLSPGKRMVTIIYTAIFLICLHFIEILLWAIAYLLVAGDELPSLEAAVYFSAVTFTTLGYGDITLSSDWRLLSGFEAIDGIVLIGWTTAFLFAVLQKTWNPPGASTRGDNNE